MLIDNGQANTAIGGFLGVGEKDIAVKFNSIMALVLFAALTAAYVAAEGDSPDVFGDRAQVAS